MCNIQIAYGLECLLLLVDSVPLVGFFVRAVWIKFASHQ